MQENRTRYPSYQVLKEKDNWDKHSREIVLQRLGPFPGPRWLAANEKEVIIAMAKHLLYEERQDILDYIVYHIDRLLSSDKGEDQRQVGTPKFGDLVRQGINLLNEQAKKQGVAAFIELPIDFQLAFLNSLQRGMLATDFHWSKQNQKAFFNKITTEIVGAYYSHPTVWSEIGYGGPAYPRGYVRIEKGLTDPWEAKRDEES